MKYFLLFSLLISSLFSRSQNIYGSISGGYYYNSNNNQPPSYIVNTYHQLFTPWFWGQENYSFHSILHADMSFGHMLTENIGYELAGSYLKPMNINNSSDYGLKIMKGDFIQSSLKVILSVPIKKINIYAKIGVNMVNGRITYLQTIVDGNINASTISDALLEYEYRRPFSFGFNGALGMNVPISKKFSFFTEVSFLNQDFSPKSAKIIGYSINGTDFTGTSDPYYSQIEFGDDSEWYYWSSDDKSKPQKLYKRNYSLGGFGLTFGFKYILWTKKNDIPESWMIGT